MESTGSGSQPTIVLVHGAWGDATGFDGVIRILQSLVESLEHRYFGPIPNPPTSLVRKPTPTRAFPGRERLTISRWVGNRRLIMLWPAPIPGSKDDLTLRVAVEIALHEPRLGYIG